MGTPSPDPKDAERLLKLWEAYKAQEEELREARRESMELRARLAESEGAMRRLLDQVRSKELEIEALQKRVEALESSWGERKRTLLSLEEVEELRSKVEELSLAYERERERLAKLFLAYEELEAERDRLKRALDSQRESPPPTG